MPKRTNTFEVVEDSEPEREERRRQGIGEGTASIKNRAGNINANNAKTTPSVLELSDDSYAGRPQAISTPIIRDPLQVITHSIVDISDDELPTLTDQQQNPSVNDDAPQHNIASTSTAPKVPPFSSSRNHALTGSSDSEHDRDDEDRMKLGRFAYLHPSRSNSRAAPSRSNSIPATDKELPEPTPKNKATRAKPQHRFTSDFTELELTRLVKCISCDIRWTTRKGVAQKMTHIQSCAKKNALTDDTVKTLIRKDIDKVIAETPTVPNTVKKGKGKGINPEDAAPSAPKTVLEEVVQGTETKRKGRRVEVVETVKDALEIRGVILDRARTVLGERVMQNTQEALNHQPTEGFTNNRVLAMLDQGMGTGPEAAPTTQVFGKSALGQRHAHNMGFGGTLDQQPVFRHENSQNEDIEAPLATQGFAPSKLGGLHRPLVKPHSTMQYVSPPGSPSRACKSPCSQSSSNASHSIIDLVSSSSRDPSPQTRLDGGYAEALQRSISHLQHPLQPSPVSSPQKASALRAQQVSEPVDEHTSEYALDGDGDAFLHYDPILENPRTDIIQHQSLYHELPHTGHIDFGAHPSLATNQRASKPRRSSSSDNPEGPTVMFVAEKSAKSRGKQRAKQDKPLLDDEWEEELKSRILCDEKLHLRILRYEPLPFDVFLAMVATDDKPSGKLKLALSTFLDKQAINFFNTEPSKRRR